MSATCDGTMTTFAKNTELYYRFGSMEPFPQIATLFLMVFPHWYSLANIARIQVLKFRWWEVLHTYRTLKIAVQQILFGNEKKISKKYVACFLD